VELLDGWQKLHLRGQQRAMFFIWLSDHTKAEIHPDTFQEKLTEWLLCMNNVKALYAEALTIQSEILYSSHTDEREIFQLTERSLLSFDAITKVARHG
jgi:hypothetical protein